jgi:hypothetical protein
MVHEVSMIMTFHVRIDEPILFEFWQAETLFGILYGAKFWIKFASTIYTKLTDQK